MKEEDWYKIQKNWWNQFHYVKLQVDGYTITMHLMQNKNKLQKLLFVDGVIEGKWFISPDKHPESKFYQSRAWRFYTSKFRKDMEAIWGKRAAAKRFDWGRVYYTKKMHRTSFTAFRKHYEKNFKSIELIS
ncbi:MAG: hypothetical protein K9I29_02630 [Bacteroidales bacterium]|nr:hypothetical protein [Bacteroidales bacterium]